MKFTASIWTHLYYVIIKMVKIKRFCGDLEKYHGEFTITSYDNVALLIFSSDWAVIKTGFKLNITITTNTD